MPDTKKAVFIAAFSAFMALGVIFDWLPHILPAAVLMIPATVYSYMYFKLYKAEIDAIKLDNDLRRRKEEREIAAFNAYVIYPGAGGGVGPFAGKEDEPPVPT